jgi:hypothetical protein
MTSMHQPSRQCTPTYRTYAVAVRESNELFQFLTIARDPQGNVYVNILHNRQGPEWERWKPHASYHASGQHHQKSFGHKSLVFFRQRPDENFRDAVNVVTMAIPVDEPRRLNKPRDTTEFHDVFEIQTTDLAEDTQIAIDLTEPHGDAIITPGAQIIGQIAFTDAIPRILVTIFAPKR